jgi:lipoprotein-releasing system permease protein
MKIKNVNLDIAITHIITRKRQTIVAALGVMLGIAIYLFMNSLSEGFSTYSTGEIFKNNAHLKIYKEDKISSGKFGYYHFRPSNNYRTRIFEFYR